MGKLDTIMKYLKCGYAKIAFLMLPFCLMGSLTQAQTLGSLYPPTDKIQHREVTIAKDMALTQAMEKLEEQFNVAFLYRTDALAGKKIAQRIIIADNVEEALTQALSGQNLDFKYLNPKTYGIFAGKKPSEQQQQPPSSLQEEITGSVTDANSGQTLPRSEEHTSELQSRFD